MDADTKAITLGHPSYIWGHGQERRLAIVRRHVALERARILDVGCGIGAYMTAFRRYSEQVYGVDLDEEKVAQAAAALSNVAVAPAEVLPFRSDFFDVVFSHEVIEHVGDDQAAIAEAVRVLAPGGRLVIFAPNRLYPFETHGFYLGKRYYYRLLPLVNYLPRFIRDRFVPQVRVYSTGDMRRLLKGLGLKIEVHRQIYPAFDDVERRRPRLAKWLRRALYTAEVTPLQAFGLSHFVVARKECR